MGYLYPYIHFNAAVLKCTKGRGRVRCSFPEASQVAYSYRGELVRLMAIHLILLAINEVYLGLKGFFHIFPTAFVPWTRSRIFLSLESPQAWHIRTS
jgi:hypothetical protein